MLGPRARSVAERSGLGPGPQLGPALWRRVSESSPGNCDTIFIYRKYQLVPVACCASSAEAIFARALPLPSSRRGVDQVLDRVWVAGRNSSPRLRFALCSNPCYIFNMPIQLLWHSYSWQSTPLVSRFAQVQFLPMLLGGQLCWETLCFTLSVISII